MKVKSGSVKSFESEEFSKWLEESEKAKAEYVAAIKDLEAKGNSKEAQKLTKEYEEFCINNIEGELQCNLLKIIFGLSAWWQFLL